MFTGFASENTPAIQVWELSSASSAINRISFADDCSPIQIFKTGSNVNDVEVYLPTSPIEGKQITIVNQRFGSNNQILVIRSSDRSGNGTGINIFQIGCGGMLVLVYSKQFISYGDSSGVYQSGWLPLNQGAGSAVNTQSVLLGGNYNIASGARSSVVGGSSSVASASSSSVAGGSSNTASGTNSAVVGGSSNSASNTNAFVGGGTSNTASGQHTFVGGGSGNLANQSFSAVVGGGSNQATAQLSSVFGGANGSTRSIQGYTVFPASDGPVDAQVGKQQLATLLIGRQTTDATATVLASNTSAASTTNQVILPNNSAYFFQGQVIAGKTAAGDAKGWTIEGVIKRGANAASTTLVGSTVTSLYADAGAATWSIAVTADTTNGGLKVEVTGQAATTIRWVAQIRTTEMTY